MKHTSENETPVAKLRNQLTPLYGLAQLVIKLNTNPELIPIIIESAQQAINNKEEIDKLLKEIEK